MEIKEIIKLCESALGKEPERVERLAGAGSTRRYYRLYFAEGRDDSSPETLVATSGDNLRENECFCRLAKLFEGLLYRDPLTNCRVPSIYGHTEDYSIYLQSDMGDTDLLSLINHEKFFRDGLSREQVVLKDIVDKVMSDVIREDQYAASGTEDTFVEMSDDDYGLARSLFAGLIDIQLSKGWEGIVFNAPFSRRRVMWDLNYFKYSFVKVVGLEFDEQALEDDFNRLADDICRYPSELEGFMYRDFQSRNVMATTGGFGLIDFQGGMRGPVIYDAVSFIWQAKARFTPDQRRRLMELYVDMLSSRSGLSPDVIGPYVGMFRLLRTLQVLGAYGLRGLVEHKSHFIESIPGGLRNLASLVDEGVTAPYGELDRVARRLAGMERFRRRSPEGLTVEVWSFSYKKGYPENLTGNGGGFVFDCRGLHNPGRYDEYKKLTGRDDAVIEFLEMQGETPSFLEAAFAMVDPTVSVYIRRGFTDLQIAFGCTGGRHRSVYCAEAMARHLREKFPSIKVKLIHREQNF